MWLPTGSTKTTSSRVQLLECEDSSANIQAKIKPTVFFNIIESCNIIDKIGYFTLDNASNNGTVMQHIAQQLSEQSISFNPVERRLRCLGHVINLVGKALLWATDAEAFQAEITNQQDLQQEAEELATWRPKGPLGKLHNMIVWICRTPQRRDWFSECVKKALGPGTKALSLINGNSTWWGGDYDSLIRALELRDPLEDFIVLVIRQNEDQDFSDSNSTYSLELHELILTDWDILKEIMYILQPFCKWKLILQKKSHFGQLHDIFPAMDELLNQLEWFRDHEVQHIRISIHTAWIVLNK